jgi:flagellar M-ring protein FliF
VPFLATVKNMPMRSKLIAGASLLGVLMVAFLLLRLATAPSYSLLSSGLDPAQTGKITAALDEQAIPYELRSNGTALAVETASVAQARVALAGAGVSLSSAGGTDEGWKLFDDQKLGASEMQQQVTYQRALEGEVASTVNGVSGVEGAQVQLVLPEDNLFADEATPATAAVAMSNGSDTLQPGAVQGIAQLVSSSVKGLKSENVTITDGTGQLLWPQGDGTTAGNGAASKQALEAKFNRSLEANLNGVLTRTLGANKAQVQVNSDLNADKTKRTELTYAKKGVPTKTTTEKEKLRGGSATTGGTAGTGANIPTYSAGAGGSGANSNYQRTTKNEEMALNKTVSETQVAPGAVNKLNVALLVDKSVPTATVDSLKQTIATAAGLDAKRGDPPITVTQMPFAKPETPKAGPVPTNLLGPIKWAGLGLASLLFLFFMRRGLKKREGETLASPSWLTEIEEPTTLAALEQGAAMQQLDGQATIQLPPRVPDAGLRQLDQLMEREPERVAAQVKAWIGEE